MSELYKRALCETSPYLRGVADFCAGKAAPPIPKGGATWAEKLYHRGWCDARDEKTAITKKIATRSDGK
jgi:hypothetical protein